MYNSLQNKKGEKSDCMLDFKNKITDILKDTIEIEDTNLLSYVEVPKDSSMGDYSFPCFRLAKELKKSPQIIANEIKEKLDIENSEIEKVEIVGGYLNFFLKKEIIAKEVINEFASSQEFGKSEIGKGKNIIIDYSAPNIAKPFHIGHLRSTVIGGALYNIYKYLGYNTIGINHLGDYRNSIWKVNRRL